MYPTVRQQPEQMQPPATGARLLDRVHQHRIGVELTILDHQIDLGDVHVDHAPGADVEMSHLAVSHLPGGQANVTSAGVDQRVGILGEQAIIGGLARQRDSVGWRRRSIAPAIEDDEDERFGRSHKVVSDSINWRIRFSSSRNSGQRSVRPR